MARIAKAIWEEEVTLCKMALPGSEIDKSDIAALDEACLTLRRAIDRAERRGSLSVNPLPDDVEMEIEPCYGLGGIIRARAVTIPFVPGMPEPRV